MWLVVILTTEDVSQLIAIWVLRRGKKHAILNARGVARFLCGGQFHKGND